jgi:hypothetical protein
MLIHELSRILRSILFFVFVSFLAGLERQKLSFCVTFFWCNTKIMNRES